MATPWIKFEITTPDKPEVCRISETLRLDPDSVVGKLVRLWAWADANSIDGDAIPVTDAFIDRLAHRKGFAAAMRDAGWIAGESGCLSFPHFQRHNGQSAKARVQTEKRVIEHRTRNGDTVTKSERMKRVRNATTVTEPLPDKSTEKKDEYPLLIPPADADKGQNRNPATRAEVAAAIVALYPRRERQAEAMQAVVALLKAGDDPALIEAGTRAAAAEIQRQPAGALNVFVPSALNFFKDRRWADDPATMFRNQHAKSGAPAGKLDLGGRQAGSYQKI